MNEIDYDKLITYARTWIDTPWHHNQRCIGVGVDCIQFALACYDYMGLRVGDPVNYHRRPRGNSLQDYIASLPDVVLQPEDSEIKKGQLLLFRIRQVPHHVGIATSSDTFIHSDESKAIRRVVEAPLGKWRRRLASKYNAYEVE